MSSGRLAAAVCSVAVALLVGACSPSPPSTAGGHGHDEVPDVGAGELAVAVPGFDLAVGGPQRFVVGLFTSDRTDIGYGTVALRFRWFGDGTTTNSGSSDWSDPVNAEFRLLPGTATDTAPGGASVLAPGQGRGVYVTGASFDRAGFWEVAVDGDIAHTDADAGVGAFDVLADHQVPAVGDAGIASDNPTLSTYGVEPEALDSRATAHGEIPDPDLHRTSIRNAVEARRPAVVVFSTPTYCLSRFCGPVTEMVAEVAADYSDRAEFIHIEIWEDFEARRLNPTAEEWLYRDGNLQEPWVFLIGADGRIVARWDNVVIRADLEAELAELPRMEPA